MTYRDSPILYSFRRCPYAIRARFAIASSGQRVELREVILRDKPSEMLAASPKGTVPVLVLPDGKVLEQSLDIMDWALAQEDCEGLLNFAPEILEEMRDLIVENDGPFKEALDRYKYPGRSDGIDIKAEKRLGSIFVNKLEQNLMGKKYLFGDRMSLADIAILPFIRQFAHVDRDWFWQQDWKNVIRWLEEFLDSTRFSFIMKKYPQWNNGDEPLVFQRSE
ncbi:MAG: glutathione S-transferase [Rhizobiaceae bacterium]